MSLVAPPEINGKPAALVTVSVEDKINIGNFENVTINYGVARWVEDVDDVIIQTHKYLCEEVCEAGLAEQRLDVLESLKKKNTKSKE